VVGPGDYRDSAWFNRTRHVDELFVPTSCCLDSAAVSAAQRRRLTSGSSKSVDKPSVCQIDAILLPEPGANKPPVTALKTQVFIYLFIYLFVCLFICLFVYLFNVKFIQRLHVI